MIDRLFWFKKLLRQLSFSLDKKQPIHGRFGHLKTVNDQTIWVVHVLCLTFLANWWPIKRLIHASPFTRLGCQPVQIATLWPTVDEIHLKSSNWLDDVNIWFKQGCLASPILFTIRWITPTLIAFYSGAHRHVKVYLWPFDHCLPMVGTILRFRRIELVLASHLQILGISGSSFVVQFRMIDG